MHVPHFGGESDFLTISDIGRGFYVQWFLHLTSLALGDAVCSDIGAAFLCFSSFLYGCPCMATYIGMGAGSLCCGCLLWQSYFAGTASLSSGVLPVFAFTGCQGLLRELLDVSWLRPSWAVGSRACGLDVSYRFMELPRCRFGCDVDRLKLIMWVYPVFRDWVGNFASMFLGTFCSTR